MRTIHALTALAILAFLAGCASSPTQVASSDSPQHVCYKETMTGTTITQLVCRVPQTPEERRDAVRDFERARTTANH